MSEKKFVTAINCMDGRVQLPVINWMKKEYAADFVDIITEPGPNKIVAENSPSEVIESLKKKVAISVKKHESTHLAIIGHADCAGNPVETQTQWSQIRKAVQNIQSWGFDISIVGLWVDDAWTVNKII